MPRSKDIKSLFKDFDKLFSDFDDIWETKAVRKLERAFAWPEPPDKTENEGLVEIKGYNDGTCEFACPGFGQDDLDLTVEGKVATFVFDNDKHGDLTIQIDIPVSTTRINVEVSNGVCTYSLVHKPSDVEIHFGEFECDCDKDDNDEPDVEG